MGIQSERMGAKKVMHQVGSNYSLKSLYWLGFGLIVAIIPLMSQISWWILLIAVLLLLIRIQIYRKKIAAPLKIVKILCVICCITLLWFSHGNVISLQSFVSLLTLTACLKLLELETKRDYLLLVFLGCFVSASQLLFSKSLPTFMYVICCVIIFHLCLYLIHLCEETIETGNKAQRAEVKPWKMSVRTIGKVAMFFLQALPIALVLFLVMPRIGSLWKLPLNQNIAKTGVSDSLTAGDIGKLNQDFSPAMRVTFDSKITPSQSQMYWRAVVMADFDGVTWRQSKNEKKTLSMQQRDSLQKLLESSKDVVSYQVMLESSGRSWLYALNTAVVDQSHVDITQREDYSINRSSPVINRYQYNVKSLMSYQDARPLSASDFQLNTTLPNTKSTIQVSNPQARAYAKQLQKKYPQPEQFIKALMKNFSDDFVYTLAPGKLSEDNSIDNFLFDTKRGYCEYFASSTAFVLRAAGIPSRIVAGYQGGQWNADNTYLLITQAQAHAWVEVWLEGKGWTRLDPTAVVAPQRIDQGSTSFLTSLQNSRTFIGKLQQWSVVRQLRLNWDNVNYQWHKWVLGYDTKIQLSFISKLLGGVDAWRIALFILLGLSVGLVPFVIKQYLSRRKLITDPLIKRLKKLDNKLAKLGIARAKSETITHFLQRAAKQSIANTATFNAIERSLNNVLYNQSNTKLESDLSDIDKLITKIKLR